MNLLQLEVVVLIPVTFCRVCQETFGVDWQMSSPSSSLRKCCSYNFNQISRTVHIRNTLQYGLNTVYDWTTTNNIELNENKFHHLFCLYHNPYNSYLLNLPQVEICKNWVFFAELVQNCSFSKHSGRILRTIERRFPMHRQLNMVVTSGTPDV